MIRPQEEAGGLAGRCLANARGHHLYDEILTILPSDFPGEDHGSILKHGALWPDGRLPSFLLICADVRIEPCRFEVGRPGEVDPLLLVGATILLPGDSDSPFPVEGHLAE